MKIRIISLFIIVSMMIGVFISDTNAVDYIYTEGPFKYKFLTNSVVITGYIGQGGAVVIPKTISGYNVSVIGVSAFLNKTVITTLVLPVTLIRIDEQAFKGCSKLISVNIPENVMTVGSRAFDGCSSLQTVDIPNGLLEIEQAVFAGCSSLTSVIIPNGVKTIGSQAFSSCINIKEIILPSEVTSIGERAFIDCKGLEKIFIPDSVTTIGGYAFVECDSLKEIDIPKNVNYIGEKAFLLSDNLSKINVSEQSQNYKSISGVLYSKSGEELFFFPNANSDVFVVPDHVTKIGSDSFNQNSSLKKVTFGNNIKEIGNYAFAWCNNLQEAAFPNSLTHIGDEAFIGNYYLSNVVFPDALISIGTKAFMSCSSISKINIPGSVINIGEMAFNSCWQILDFTVSESNATYKSVDGVIFSKDGKKIIHYPSGKKGSYIIPQSVEIIGKYSFNGSGSLTGVTISDSVVAIEPYAFANCSFIGSISIPASVNLIGDYAFFGCLLENVTFSGNAPAEVGRWIFDNPDNPENRIQIFYNKGYSGWTEPWNGYKTNVIGETKTATFLNADMSVYHTAKVQRGSLIPLPVDPQMTDKFFLGWYTKDLTACYDFNFLKLTEDMTFYSGWMDKNVDDLLGSIDDGNGITLSWSSVDGAQFYEVLCAEETLDKFDILQENITSSSIKVNDEILQKGKTYNFSVRAYSSAGEKTVYSDYSEVVKVDYFKPLPVFLSSDFLTFDRDMKWISGIKVGMTVDSFLNLLKDKADVAIYLNNKMLSGSNLIGTGMIVRKKQGEEVLDEFKAVVIGDLNGDGQVSLTDFVRLKSQILGKTLLSDVHLNAADINKNGSVSLTDFVQMKSIILKGAE